MLEMNVLNPVILNRELMETEVLLSPWSKPCVIWTASKGRLWAAVCINSFGFSVFLEDQNQNKNLCNSYWEIRSPNLSSLLVPVLSQLKERRALYIQLV